jgi:hypothetical protein
MFNMRFIHTVLQAMALAAAMITSASASTLCLSGYCDAPEPPPAEVIRPIEGPSVTLEPSVLQLIPYQFFNGWNYFFSVSGANMVVVSLPYFDGWDLNQVNTPEGWAYQVVEAPPSQSNRTALWEFQNGSPGFSWVGVGASFLSGFVPTLATVEIRNSLGNVFERQVYIPLTPSAIEAGYAAANLPVPEPTNALLMASGIAILFAARQLKRRNSSINLNVG